MDSIKALQLRRKLRLNQTDFWGRVAVSQSCASRYESGYDIPAPTRILLDIAYGNNPLSLVAALRNTTKAALIQKGK